MATRIEWTDVTVNPFPGCQKISPGCQNCYAERMAMRLKGMGLKAYQDVVDDNGWTGQVGCNLAAMKVPGKGKRVFCQSMGDLFYEGVSDGDILCVYDGIRRLCLQGHTVQVLTKRPERAASLLPRINFDNQGRGSLYYAPVCPLPFVRLLQNHWFGWTAEDQPRMDERTPFGLRVPAAVRFVSLEPLLGPINFTVKCPPAFRPILRSDQICWVIVGCESGPNRRPCDTRWVADIFAQCVDAGVPRFIKQISIDGQVVKDPELIALELSDYYGTPLMVDDIRQFPTHPRTNASTGELKS
jgi:protein gp37